MTMETPNFQETLVKIARIMNEMGVPYAITGGFAVSVWGRPRSTLDIDMLIRLPEQQVDEFLMRFRQISPTVYVDEGAVRSAIARGGEFNLIDPSSGVKADFWIPLHDVSRQQLERRVPQTIGGVVVFFLSPEDLILNKLVWFQKSQSTRHLEDVESVLAVSGDRVDREYINSQSRKLGVARLWHGVCQKVPSKTISFSFSYAVFALQGPRPSMEDTSLVIDKQKQHGWLYCGVYDGHGGAEASRVAHDTISKTFFSLFDQGNNPSDAFRKAYESIDQATSDPNVGSCALDVLVRADGSLWFASVGDSRLLIVGDEDVKQLTADHRATNQLERERIERAGGFIQDDRVVEDGRSLEVTRALGDHLFRDAGVISTPQTGIHQLKPDDQWILIATDGLFDALSNDVLVRVLQTQADPDSALADLQQSLKQSRSTDNVTVILVRILHQ